jgi:ABC-type transport system substrate-binding protein
VQTLDPQFVTDVPTSRIVMHIHETLVKPDEAGTMQPALATSWSTSDDKLTWTFKLRQGVRFHDGTPFNAAAVKATFERIRDPRPPRRAAPRSPPSRASTSSTTSRSRCAPRSRSRRCWRRSAPTISRSSARAGAEGRQGYRAEPAGTGHSG